MHGKKTQLHRIAALVLVTDPRNFSTDGCVDAEFLFKFPTQRIPGLLALFYLAAGKFPLKRHRLVLGPLADKDLSVLDDEGPNHPLHHSPSPTPDQGTCTLSPPHVD